MKKDGWEVIKRFYMDSFGIPGDLVDLLADSDILTMCASGSSNDSISKMFDIDELDVKAVISAIFKFDGWTYDLEINPLRIYEGLETDTFLGGYLLFNKFKTWIPPYTSYSSDEIKTMFRICKLYKSIDLRIEKEWI